MKYYIKTVLLLLTVFSIHCGKPLEPIEGAWVQIDIPDNMIKAEYCSIVDGDDKGIYLFVNNGDDPSGPAANNGLYNYNNGVFTELFCINNRGYIYDYFQGVLWGIQTDTEEVNSIFYYDGALYTVSIPGNITITDIAGYDTGNDFGCIVCAENGVYKYSDSKGGFESLGFPEFEEVTRTDGGRYFFLNRGEIYRVGIMDSVDSDIVVENVPIPYQGWSFRRGPNVLEVYGLDEYSECAIGGYFVFIAELGIDDVWYQSIILRDDGPGGKSSFEVLLLNPLHGPDAYAISHVIGYDRNNMRAVGIIGTSLVYNDGVWLKENTSSTSDLKYWDIISADDGYYVLRRSIPRNDDISLLYSPY